METILKLKMLKEKISQNDINVKSLIMKNENDDKHYNLKDLSILNTKVSTLLDNTRQDLMEFKRLVKGIEDPELRYNMEKDFDCMQNQFEINMTVARKAMINSHKISNQKSREKLFEYSDKLRHRLGASKEKVTTEVRANQAAALTENLFSVSQMLANEVEKSGKNLETLVSSSALATETSEELKTMSHYIANSKTLLSKYGRREMTDKILTILALAFFFGCVIYVLVKRLYY